MLSMFVWRRNTKYFTVSVLACNEANTLDKEPCFLPIDFCLYEETNTLFAL